MSTDYSIKDAVTKLIDVKAIRFIKINEHISALPIGACIIENISINNETSTFTHGLQLRLVMVSNPTIDLYKTKGIYITLFDETVITLGWGILNERGDNIIPHAKGQFPEMLQKATVADHDIYKLHLGGFVQLQSPQRNDIYSKKHKQLALINSTAYVSNEPFARGHEFKDVLLCSGRVLLRQYLYADNNFGDDSISASPDVFNEYSEDKEQAFAATANETIQHGIIKDYNEYGVPLESLEESKLSPIMQGAPLIDSEQLSDHTTSDYKQIIAKYYSEAVNKMVVSILEYIESEVPEEFTPCDTWNVDMPFIDISIDKIENNQHQGIMYRICTVISYYRKESESIVGKIFSPDRSKRYYSLAELFTQLLLMYAVNNDLYFLWGEGYVQKLNSLHILVRKDAYLAKHWHSVLKEVIKEVIKKHPDKDKIEDLQCNPNWELLAYYIAPELKYYYIKVHLNYLQTCFANDSRKIAEEITLLLEQCFVETPLALIAVFNIFNVINPILYLDIKLTQVPEEHRHSVINLLFWISHYRLQYNKTRSEQARHLLLSIQLRLVNLAIEFNFYPTGHSLLNTHVNFKQIFSEERYQVLELLLSIENQTSESKIYYIMSLRRYLEQFKLSVTS